MRPEQTTTDVAQVEPSYREITEPTTGALQRLEAEASAMDKAYKIAKALSATPMVPEHFQQDKHGEVATYSLAAAILYGAELGLSAAQSAQNIFIVKGKPAVYARTMAAQVRRAGYQLEEVEATDDRVVWRGERNGKWASSEWTMARAQQAGYTANGRYQTNPQEMLRAKCIAEVCRIQYQDVLLGMADSVEELQLDSVVVQRVTRPGPRGAAALREIAAAQTAVEAAQESPAEEVAPEPPVDEPPSRDQAEKIRRLYRAKGVTGQDVLDDITQFLQLDKKLPGLSSLSAEDAQSIIDRLTEKSQ